MLAAAAGEAGGVTAGSVLVILLRAASRTSLLALWQLAIGIPGFQDRIADLASDELMLNGLHWLDLPFAVGTAGQELGTFRVEAPNTIPWPDLVLVPDPIHPSEAGARVIGEALGQLLATALGLQRPIGRAVGEGVVTREAQQHAERPRGELGVDRDPVLLGFAGPFQLASPQVRCVTGLDQGE